MTAYDAGDEPDPNLFDAAVGAYAFELDGSRIRGDDDPVEMPPVGAEIRLQGEHGVDIPLWTSMIGLIFADKAEFMQAAEIASDLADDVESWGRSYLRDSGNPEYDRVALTLVERLNAAFDGRYTFVYRS